MKGLRRGRAVYAGVAGRSSGLDNRSLAVAARKFSGSAEPRPRGSGTRMFQLSTAVLAKPVALVLFGSPGSGKGTQSKYIVEWLGIPQISTGDILREHIRRGDSIGQEIAALLRAGSLVSDDLANCLVQERVSEPDCKGGFILDGYPRTTGQAQEMMRLLVAVGVAEVVI